MIIDHIANRAVYAELDSNVKVALEFLSATDFTELESGRHELPEANGYFMVQRYETRAADQAAYESHRRFIDIQYVACGRERILWRPISELKVTHEYDEAGDYALYASEGIGEHAELAMAPGYFAIFYPEDGHAPGLNPSVGQVVGSTGAESMLKIVVKLPVR